MIYVGLAKKSASLPNALSDFQCWAILFWQPMACSSCCNLFLCRESAACNLFPSSLKAFDFLHIMPFAFQWNSSCTVMGNDLNNDACTEKILFFVASDKCISSAFCARSIRVQTNARMPHIFCGHQASEVFCAHGLTKTLAFVGTLISSSANTPQTKPSVLNPCLDENDASLHNSHAGPLHPWWTSKHLSRGSQSGPTAFDCNQFS